MPDDVNPPAPAGAEPELWEQDEELPRRPRRRLLTPLPVTLLCVLLSACGFIGGVLVEKGEGSGSSAAGASGLGARFAALRSGGGRAGAGAAAGLFGGGSGARPTTGQVAFVDGSTLYVTDAEGNTVKVSTSHATTVAKTVGSTVRAIHPGETVTVIGSAAGGGALSAETISVGASPGGGLATLFGGSSSGSGAPGAGSSASGPSLFGG